MDPFTTVVPQSVSSTSSLAIASLICSIVGVLLTMIIVGAILGIPLLILALVLGIIVLAKKRPGKGLAIAGIVISSLALISTIIAGIFIGRVVVEVAPTIRDFSQEIEQMVENDPEFAALFDDPVFSSRVEALTQEQLIERFEGLSAGEVFSIEGIGSIVETSLNAYKESLNELKDDYLQEKADGSSGDIVAE